MWHGKWVTSSVFTVHVQRNGNKLWSRKLHGDHFLDSLIRICMRIIYAYQKWKKRVRIPIVRRFCKIIDGQTVNFLLDFCSCLSSMNRCYAVRFLPFGSWCDFLFAIDWGQINKTNLLSFAFHTAWWHSCVLLHVKTNKAIQIGSDLKHCNRMKWIFIHLFHFHRHHHKLNDVILIACIDFLSWTLNSLTSNIHSRISCPNFSTTWIHAWKTFKSGSVKMLFINGNICTMIRIKFDQIADNLNHCIRIFTALIRCQG